MYAIRERMPEGKWMPDNAPAAGLSQEEVRLIRDLTRHHQQLVGIARIGDDLVLVVRERHTRRQIGAMAWSTIKAVPVVGGAAAMVKVVFDYLSRGGG
jgi:hypothetical protein